MSAFLAFQSAAVSVLRRPTRFPCSLNPASHIISRGFKLPPGEINNQLRLKKIAQYTNVRIVIPKTGRLSKPHRLREVIEAVEPNDYYIELLSLEPEPVVRIVYKKEAYRRDKEAKEQEKIVSHRNVQKEVQITWGAADADFTTKLEKIREELEKGHKLDLVFAPKKGQTLPTQEEREKKVQEVVDMFSDVASEWRARAFMKLTAAVFLRGKAPVLQEALQEPLTKKVSKNAERNQQKQLEEYVKKHGKLPDKKKKAPKKSHEILFEED